MATELQTDTIYMINGQEYNGAYLMKAVQVYEKELNRKKAYAKQKYVPKNKRTSPTLPLDTQEEPSAHDNLPLESLEEKEEAQHIPLEINEEPYTHEKPPLEMKEEPEEAQQIPLESNEKPCEHENLPLEMKEEKEEAQHIPLEINEEPCAHENLPLEITQEQQEQTQTNSLPIVSKFPAHIRVDFLEEYQRVHGELTPCHEGSINYRTEDGKIFYGIPKLL